MMNESITAPPRLILAEAAASWFRDRRLGVINVR